MVIAPRYNCFTVDTVETVGTIYIVFPGSHPGVQEYFKVECWGKGFSGGEVVKRAEGA